MAKTLIDEFGWQLLERDISFVPIAPGSKRPGQWSKERGWEGMGDWTRFAKRRPSEIDLSHWSRWPDAGIGVVLGEISNLTGLDKDYDLPDRGEDALQKAIPYSPVSKRGEKGWTRLYQYNGERSCSFDVAERRVLDVLSTGRQTVIPPTMHPSGCHYVWTAEQTLYDIVSTKELPKLPDTFLSDIARLLEPYQSDRDRRTQAKVLAPPESTGPIDSTLSVQAQYFRDLNATALSRLDEWVPKLIHDAKQDAEGWRCRATWRNAKNPNVGIHPTGIRDWGGGYGMTPIDLVMYSAGLTFGKAAETLRACLPMSEPEPIILQVGGSVVGIAPASTIQAAPAVLPWLRNKQDVAAPPPAIMLPSDTSAEPAPALPRFITEAPGILRVFADWVTFTAPKSQPELSLSAAIAFCSVVMGRTYRTQLGNRSSLYLVMVAKSTEGKEHPQACVEQALADAGLQHLIGGSGYTSSGAVYSALLKSPVHLATIDELGKLLKISRSKGNSHTEAAIDKLVEAFGRLDGVMRPPAYSTMTLSKKQVNETSVERVIYNPAITMLGATTPATFYSALTSDLVRDGFLGRCIVVESNQPRQLTRFVEKTATPTQVIEWSQAVNVGTVIEGNLATLSACDLPAVTVDLTIDEECIEMMHAIEAELNQAKSALESAGLDVLLGRTLEKALRLAMIACKADDPRAAVIKAKDLRWAIDYVRYYDMRMVAAIQREHHENEFDEQVKKLRNYILDCKKTPMAANLRKRLQPVFETKAAPRSMILKKMHMSARQFDDLVSTAVQAGLVSVQSGAPLGYAGDIIYALDEDAES